MPKKKTVPRKPKISSSVKAPHSKSTQSGEHSHGLLIWFILSVIVLLASLALNAWLVWSTYDDDADLSEDVEADDETNKMMNEEAAASKFRITDEDAQTIEDYLKDTGLNKFGDPENTVYTGGSPLFNEQTGEAINRYDYILEHNPDLRAIFGFPVEFSDDTGDIPPQVQ